MQNSAEAPKNSATVRIELTTTRKYQRNQITIGHVSHKSDVP